MSVFLFCCRCFERLTLMDIRQLQGEMMKSRAKQLKWTESKCWGPEEQKDEGGSAHFRRWESMDLKDAPQGTWPEFTDWHAPDLFEFFLWILRKNNVFKLVKTSRFIGWKCMFKSLTEDIFNIIFEHITYKWCNYWYPFHT